MSRGEVFILACLAVVSLIVGFAIMFGPLALFGAALVLGLFVLFVNIRE